MELQVFENSEFGKVRTVMLDGIPWLVGRDVAKALGYAKPENAIAIHVESDDKTTTLIRGSGSNYTSKTLIINESGVYALIFRSQLPSAKSFKHWVTSQVLPEIRQTGSYNTPQLQEQQRILKAKAEYFDQMAADEHLTGIRETSKLLHIPEQLFVKVLLDMKFAYRNSQNKLFPTERADKSDWARLIEFDKNGYCCSQMKITPLGRLWIFVKLKKQLALPYTISECLAIENIERLRISAE